MNKYVLGTILLIVSLLLYGNSVAQELVFVAKVPFSNSKNLDWGKAKIIRGEKSYLETFKLKDAIAKKSKRPDVPKWENKCLIIVEFRKHLKDELLITSFTRVYANKQKILLNLWGDNKIYSDFDHLLESWPHVERPPQKLDRE